jgi:hypothetical protein
VTATRQGKVKNTNTPRKAANAVAREDLAKLTDAELDAKIANAGRRARKVKSTSTPVFECSGTSQHRNTCFGRCLNR